MARNYTDVEGEAFRASNELLARLVLFHARRGDRVKAAQMENQWRENQKNWGKQ